MPEWLIPSSNNHSLHSSIIRCVLYAYNRSTFITPAIHFGPKAWKVVQDDMGAHGQGANGAVLIICRNVAFQRSSFQLWVLVQNWQLKNGHSSIQGPRKLISGHLSSTDPGGPWGAAIRRFPSIACSGVSRSRNLSVALWLLFWKSKKLRQGKQSCWSRTGSDKRSTKVPKPRDCLASACVAFQVGL